MLASAQVQAESFDHLKITEVVNDASVINRSSQKAAAAKVDSNFNTPDILKTGDRSRVELVAADNTVTRVGSNTVFSFTPHSRDVNLQQGSVLFTSPTGKGGGTINTKAATAGVLGTSIVVTATADGGFKLLVLEGKAKVTVPKKKGELVLNAGETFFITPGTGINGRDLSGTPVYEFRLKSAVEGSNLVKGFKNELPSIGKIQNAVASQEKKLKKTSNSLETLPINDSGLMQSRHNGASQEY